ncbi:response regulator [Bifidobacterium cuniculi]|uniref:Response regulator of two-component system n=1 Tax=Bifidobacterium cuniculi TaxID=1688 RepID=A0A087B3N3_9BIFI|nr:response regulator transcription factor [Bifidobacterium cuniculi]KFI65633.1 response regulator of two-component system [Bifidobacterium cuniculi]
MKVAIVDDDPIVCTSIGTILTATGIAEVLWSAHDGAAAVAGYARQKPDILLIDVQMPGMDGLEAAARILETDSDARILVLTTFADPDYIRRALDLHTRGYLIKQDVASVVPAVQAVMAGQVVLGAEVLSNLSTAPAAGTPAPDLAPAGEDPRFAHLTDRERDIAVLVAEGLDNRQIAAQLVLSEGTVRNRISDILAKTNIPNRTKFAVEWLASHR